jgi:hypothetical protein
MRRRIKKYKVLSIKYRVQFAILILGTQYLILLQTGCSPAEVYQNLWQSTPVKVDGNAREWELPLKLYDENTRLNYAVSNDEENLYVCIRAVNEQLQTQIIRGGMELWIDTTGKKHQQVGIRFPLTSFTAKKSSDEKTPERTSSREAWQKPDTKISHQSFLSQSQEMVLTGFRSPVSSGLTPLKNVYGINVRINWDSTGILIYEAEIPLKTLCETLFVNEKGKPRIYGFSITVNGLPTGQGRRGGGEGEENEGGMGGGRMGGGGMGGGGMHGGGGRGGGMHHSGGGSASDMNEAKSFWMQFQLAKNNH